METYPLLDSVKLSEWKKELQHNEKVKALFEKLFSEASREGIPLTSIIGHENVILACSKLEDIDTRFGKGETLLHWAASYEPAYAIPLSKVLVLLLLGANPNIPDDLGRTPLHWAINHDCSDIAEDEELHYDRRSQANAVKVVYQLLHYNASPDIVDIYGATPYCHALWSKCFDIADILRPLTSDHFRETPGFLLADNESSKSIRCSKVEQWINQNTSNVAENEERLQRLLSSPGIGLLQHQDEVKQQKQQVMSLFKRLSCIIAKEDNLLEFIPTLAGSMAEGTKCQKPDEQDMILRLLKFEDVCIPEKSEYAPEGVITLKFTGNESKTNEYKKYILDGYLNREEILYSLVTKLERALSLISNWSEKVYINIYPTHYPTAELKQAIDTGDIGNLTLVWHGKYYKQINLSVDIVPAIIIRNWKPADATPIYPTGGTVPNETFLILRASIETFEYDLELVEDEDKETLAPDSTDVDTLNGEVWDSGSDCISDISDDDNNEPLNSTSILYNTYMVRKIRDENGISVPTIKRLLRQCDDYMTEEMENQEQTVKTKTAYDDYSNLHPLKGPRTSQKNDSDSFQPDMAGEAMEYKDEKTVLSPRNPPLKVNSNLPSTSTDSDNCRSQEYQCENTEIHGEKRKLESDMNVNENNDEMNDTENIKIKKFFGTILQEIDQIQKKRNVHGEPDSDDESVNTETESSENEENFNEIILNLFSESICTDKAGYEAFQNILESKTEYHQSELIDDNNSDMTSADLDDLHSDPPREDMGFKISYSKWENETMATFPNCIKVAYMLSKILVSYVPKIRIPLNRGLRKMKGYGSVKDIFSYLLKMALFHVVRKHTDRLRVETTSADKLFQDKTNKSKHDDYFCEEIIYSRTTDHCATKMYPTTKYSFSSREIIEVAFWVDKLFSEIETTANSGYLGAYFDPKLNILDRIAMKGKQKGSPYPSLLYLRKHCQMIRALVCVEEKKTDKNEYMMIYKKQD